MGTRLYESPDGGKTIYVTEAGSSFPVLLDEENALFIKSVITGKWQNKIKNILELSYTVPALRDQLDKLEEIYRLVKDEND